MGIYDTTEHPDHDVTYIVQNYRCHYCGATNAIASDNMQESQGESFYHAKAKFLEKRVESLVKQLEEARNEERSLSDESARLPSYVKEPTVKSCTSWRALNERNEEEIHLECSMSNGQKGVFIVVDGYLPELAEKIERFLNSGNE